MGTDHAERTTRSRVFDLARATVPGLIVALPPLFWIVLGLRRASYAALGRDQGIFQYIAWAVTHGARDYLDVRDVNGPLTHLIHVILLALGGRDEHRFRTIDLVVSSLVFALVGACIVGIGRLRSQRDDDIPKEIRITNRISWGIAGWVVLSGQYLLYIFWDTSQRESFFDWFMLSSIALQLAAQTLLHRNGSIKRARVLLVIAFALSILPWFGKATYALFTFTQIAALMIDDLPQITLKSRSKMMIGGAIMGAIIPVLFLLIYADVGSFLRLYFVDVPTLYRFIWPRTMSEMFSVERGHSTQVVLAIVTTCVMIGMIIERHLPKRALAIALMPACGLLSVIAQAKGFDYHFHPVTSGIAVQWLTIVIWSWERFREERRLTARLVPFALSGALGVYVAVMMTGSPHFKSTWLDDRTSLANRETPAYFNAYRFPDFFPWEIRQAAAYLKANTSPNDTIQTYGMDPYVLFLAERKSATPYIYAYDLNADAELAGGFLSSALHPNASQTKVIEDARDAHDADLRARLMKEPPAAFVFFDRAPLISSLDAWSDFETHCRETAAWVLANYEETTRFGDVRVWMRRSRK